jgi:MFS family permease
MPPFSPILLIYAARALRGFGDGFAVIVLPAYLTALGYSPATVGFVATTALLGSAATTLGVGFLGRRHDLRNLLLAGALLMAATGAALAGFAALAVILLVVFVGTMNPSAGDTGLMIPLEHAALAEGVSHAKRTQTFARYSLVGAMATAAGSLAAALPDALVARGLDPLLSLKAMFVLYAALGLASAVIYTRIPPMRSAETPPPTALGPSRGIVIKLAALFSLDAFAGGFVVQSLLALWLFEAYDLSLAAASLFFFWTSVLTAFSYLVAVRLSRRIGLINTMVFTHIPSSLCLIAAAFAPSLMVALAFLLLRSALSQMDVPVRSSYVMAVVTPEERPAAASFTAVPRTLASSVSPTFAGILLAGAFPALPLILCGVLKIAYDLALLFTFRHVRPPEEMGG